MGLMKCGFTHTQADTAMTQSKVSEIIPFASDIERLCIFSFLDSDSIIIKN